MVPLFSTLYHAIVRCYPPASWQTDSIDKLKQTLDGYKQQQANLAKMVAVQSGQNPVVFGNSSIPELEKIAWNLCKSGLLSNIEGAWSVFDSVRTDLKIINDAIQNSNNVLNSITETFKSTPFISDLLSKVLSKQEIQYYLQNCSSIKIGAKLEGNVAFNGNTYNLSTNAQGINFSGNQAEGSISTDNIDVVLVPLLSSLIPISFGFGLSVTANEIKVLLQERCDMNISLQTECGPAYLNCTLTYYVEYVVDLVCFKEQFLATLGIDILLMPVVAATLAFQLIQSLEPVIFQAFKTVGPAMNALLAAAGVVVVGISQGLLE